MSDGRAQGMRQAPLRGRDNVVTMQMPNGGPKVYASPGYMVFIEAMWHGGYQQVPVDPETIPALVEALVKARMVANADDVVDLITGAHAEATP